MKNKILFIATCFLLMFIGVAHSGLPPIYGGGTSIEGYTVATLPGSPSANDLAIVTDGATAADCTVGGGSEINLCIYSGSAWVIAGDGTAAPGGGIATIEEGDVQVGDADIAYLDFGVGFALTENPDTEININFDVTPASGNATLIVEEDALQVKYDSTLTEGTSGLGIATDGVDSAHYAADSIDNEHINWADIDNLGDEGLLTVADTTDTTSFVALFESATGDLAIKTDLGITYNAGTGVLTATGFAGPLTGNVTGNADTATTAALATTLTITDNESTAEINAILFTAGGDLDGGNLGIESDGDLTYTPSTGTLAATILSDGTSKVTGGTIELGHATDTTLARSGAGDITIEGNAIYRAGGTDVALADGGTNADLSDPNADKLVGWDDTDGGGLRYITIGAGLTYTAATDTLSTTGAATAYDDITDPDAAGSITFADTYSATYTSATTATDFFVVEATGAFGDISIVKIDQNTGNATDGTMLEIATDDADIDHLLLQFGAADYVTHKIVDAGTYTIDVTTDGTALVSIADPLSIGTSNAFTTGTIELGAASDTTIARSGAGDITIEGNAVYRAGGTDVADADVADNITITNIAQVQDITATAAEINTPLDGASVTLTEFQELETIGATTISANQWALLGGLAETLGAAEVNVLDGATAATADINIIDGISDSGTLTAAELLYVDGVTSAIQTQLNAKSPAASPTFTGIVALPIAADPTTDADGEISMDADAWAAGRDALEIFDGTASTYVLAALASDTPTDGQVAKWNTGGTITWEDDSTGTGLGTNLSSATDNIVSDNGTFLIGGTGGANNETLDFDFETTANTVGVATTSGATLVDFGAIGLAAGSFDASDGNLTNVGIIQADELEPDAVANGSLAIQGGQTATNTLKLQGYDVDGAAYLDVVTITSANLVTMAINTSDWDIDATGAITGVSLDADGTGNSISNIENADIKAAAAIDATKIADGSVTSAEFQYLASVTSDIQTQINAQEGELTNSAGLAAAIDDETGTGVVVFGTAPTFTTSISIGSDPADQGVIRLDNATVIAWEDATETTLTHVDNTGLAINTNLEAGTITEGGVAVLNNDEMDASSELLAIIDDETGTGVIVFGTSPTFTTSILAASNANIGSAAAEFGHVFIGDDFSIQLGADQDWTLQYDETGGADQLLLATTATAATATTDPMFQILVGTTPTADQQVFGIAKGTQGTNTDLLTLDEDGDLVVTGTITSNASGDSYIQVNNNASLAPSGYRLYVEATEWKVSENGAEEILLTQEDGATLTGTTWSFAGVTNLVLPTTAADASGEISMSTGNQLKWHDGTKVVTIDTTPTDDNYVLKYDNASATFTLEADETGGTPAWNSVTDPTADQTLAHDAGEETAFTYTGNYTTGTQFLVQQLTGNPSGGVLFEARAADADTVVARLGDGTNYWQVSTAGVLSNAGTGTINFAAASDILVGGSQLNLDDLASGVPDLAADSIDAITEIAAALKAGADGTLLTGTAGTNTYTAVWNADGDLVDGYDPTSKANVADVDVEMLIDVTGEGTAATYSLFDDNDGTYSFRAIAAGDLPADIVVDSIDTTGAADIDIGSADVTDITFLSDGDYIFSPPADTDITVTFSGTTNSGSIKWMEDEATFVHSSVLSNTPQDKTYNADDTSETVGTDILSSTVLITTDNDSTDETVNIQDGTVDGQQVSFICVAGCDGTDDGVDIDVETDSTCIGCEDSGIFSLGTNGDSVTIVWSATNSAWYETGFYQQ